MLTQSKLEKSLDRGSMIFIALKYNEAPIRGAEIGVLEGVHSTNLLSSLNNLEHIYLIDPYEDLYLVTPSEEFKDKDFSGVLKLKANAKNLLSQFGTRKTWIQKRFGDCTKNDIKEDLDFIYIDGDHSYEGVKIDLEQAHKFVKPDGVLCGHDFQMEGVENAVREYCKTNNYLLETWGGEWWFINTPMQNASLKMFSK